MGKGGQVRANLRATRAMINNATTSAQTRAFKARMIAKQKREAEERKLRAAQAAEKTTEPKNDEASVANDETEKPAPETPHDS